MPLLKVMPEAISALQNFSMPTGNLGFCTVFAPVMVKCEYSGGKWQELQLVPYGPLQLDPCTKVLHYGQEIFEGMKAHFTESEHPILFRPEENFKRMNRSAQRIGMPQIPQDLFFAGIEGLVAHCRPFIPKLPKHFLYIRPFLFCNEVNMGIKPSDKFLFLIIACPSSSYFGGSVAALIEREYSRAMPGGTGNVKAGGNYANALMSTNKAYTLGYQQVLWLDSCNKKYVEEFSGMNFFALIDGTLCTPMLTDTILPGITRDSILTLAKELGIPTWEGKIEIQQLVQDIQSGRCSEGFACGTAAVVAPLQALGEFSGEKYSFAQSPGPITQKIYTHLVEIQEGKAKAPAHWVRPVMPLS